MEVDFLALDGERDIDGEIRHLPLRVPAIGNSLKGREIVLGPIRQVAGFAPSNTVKRTILDQRTSGGAYA